MFFGRRNMDEAALCQLASRAAFLLLLLGLAEHLKLSVVDRRGVLRRALQLVDVPRSDPRLYDARQLRLRIAGIPCAEHQRRRRQSRDRVHVFGILEGREGSMGVFRELGGANEGVAQAVPRFEKGNGFLVAVGDRHLGHQRRAAVARFTVRSRLEQRLHPIGLGAYAVDRCHLGAIRQRIDVVADACVGRRENHRIGAFHRQQFLPHRQSDGACRFVGATLGEGIVEFGHDDRVSSMTFVMQRAWPSCPGQSIRMLNRRNGMPGKGGSNEPRAARRKIGS